MTDRAAQCPPDDLGCLEQARLDNLNDWAARLEVLATDAVPMTYAMLPADKQDNFINGVTDVIAGLHHIEGDELNMDQLIKILQDAGVEKLRSDKAGMYIYGGKMLLTFVGVELAVEKPHEVEIFRGALYRGLLKGYTAVQDSLNEG